MLYKMFQWLKSKFKPGTARKTKGEFDQDNPFLIL
jgi:hypothetical protein